MVILKDGPLDMPAFDGVYDYIRRGGMRIVCVQTHTEDSFLVGEMPAYD